MSLRPHSDSPHPTRTLPELPPEFPGDTVYRIARVLFKVFYRMIGNLETSGQENIPRRGPVIFAPNHQSHLDPPLVGTDMDRITWFMAKEELFSPPLWGLLMRHLHGFPVKRHTADRAALRNALLILDRGETVTVFPEGERSRDGRLKPAELGVGMIALKSRAPVIPVALIGTGEIFPPGAKWMKPAQLRVKYGRSVDLADLYGRRETRQTLQAAADRIMAAVADLLGEPPPVRETESSLPSDTHAPTSHVRERNGDGGITTAESTSSR